ncbi:MAG: NAD-glutamate dehydrogenase [Gammaproteobacteria bacterium]
MSYKLPAGSEASVLEENASGAVQGQKDRLIAKAISEIGTRLPADQRALTESFVRQYYAGVAPEDLVGREPADLRGAALCHLELARVRRGGARKLRIYNPDPNKHGWRSQHTIVEIVGPDMPFLVDSAGAAINRRGFTLHLVIHPVLKLKRVPQGRLVGIFDADAPGYGVLESLMHFEIDCETDPGLLRALTNDLNRVLDDVRLAVEDWKTMSDRVREAIQELHDVPLGPAEIAQSVAFLAWLLDGNFTFLGYREQVLVKEGGEELLHIVPGSGLGILREREPRRLARSFAELPLQVRRLAREPSALILTKSSSKSTVHRSTYLDYVGIKRFDPKGRVIGERRFLGLYTSAAYHSNPRQIPVIGRKIERVLQRSGSPPESHAGRALLNILETYPRDELFQIGEDELLEIAMGILHLQERQRVRLFVRRDPFERFYSCLIYIPRDHYNTDLRDRMQAILLASFEGDSVDFTVSLSESVLARLNFVVRTQPGRVIPPEVKILEERIANAVRPWQDELAQGLIQSHGEEAGKDLFTCYRQAFPSGYRDAYDVHEAIEDIALVARALEQRHLQLRLYRPMRSSPGALGFKLYQVGTPVPLSSVIPMLENMDVMVLSENPFQITPEGYDSAWVQDFRLLHQEPDGIEVDKIKDIFEQCFAQVWEGRVENDGLNRLVLHVGLGWRDVMLLRACCRYLKQTEIPFSQGYMEQVLYDNPAITRESVALFHSRFDPDRRRHAATESCALVAQIEDALEGVASLDADRILRRFLALILAMLRTNYFQKNTVGLPEDYLCFKLSPALLPELPLPRPMFEIFVYAARFEGIHLRGGLVARGGIRWSDRREDFRREILGLMKAQMVKNAVIVPVGAKGGFVLKGAAAGGGAKELRLEAEDCYRDFIQGLLDVTDNRLGERIIPPPATVRYDADDPYLVVAADKGTATFSDLANSISAARGFWLGDAFASGGSNGYDHKQMGITARGAWASVKEHFYALGIDIHSTDFTVVGIGDMAGDVFGNGMLLSEHIKLIGAFNHEHVFLDPDPDPAASYQERRRLFALAGSSWADYRAEILSKGGGVYKRSAKSVAIAPEARKALGITAIRLTPNELVQAILRAPVDLLWNGGIGTFVKSTLEGHSDVGDRINDVLRVNAAQLRCRVVAEGGNLGFTQQARIEYARNGGRINTDFIDNSGGVDCSDREVNIKIALDGTAQDKKVSLQQRNRLLALMKDEVAAQVLQDNERQARAISIAVLESKTHLDWYARLITVLERALELDRAFEGLPTDEEIAKRKATGEGLTRPEVAVLLAHVKLALFAEILKSKLLDDPYFSTLLLRYFPQPMHKRFDAAIESHRLRREIVSTLIANSMVNRVGIDFAYRLSEDLASSIPEIARAYIIARDVFDARSWEESIRALHPRADYMLQNQLIVDAQGVLEKATRWFLRHRCGDMASVVEPYRAVVARVATMLGEAGDDAQSAEPNTGQRAPAEQIALWGRLVSALDINEVNQRTGASLEVVIKTFKEIEHRLQLDGLRQSLAQLPAQEQWHYRASQAFIEEVDEAQVEISTQVLKTKAKNLDPIDAWVAQHQQELQRYQSMMANCGADAAPDIALLSVIVSRLRDLYRRPEACRTT